MSALPLGSPASGTGSHAHAVAVLRRARSYGHLRLVNAEQAPVVREATEYDLRLLPRWQRGGDGVHDLATPREYALGVQWIPTRQLVRAHDGRRYHCRRVASGVPHRPWQSREWWLQVLLPAALAARPEATHRKIAAATLTRVMTEATKYAHPGTGRACIVRVDRLSELCEVDEKTVRRAFRAVQALGLAVLMRPGRMLDCDEKIRAWRGGSTQRGLANEWAFVIPARTPGHLFGVQAPRLRPPLTLIQGRRAASGAVDKPVSAPCSRQALSPLARASTKSRNLTNSVPQPSTSRSARETERPSAARATKKERHPSAQQGHQQPQKRPQRRSRRSYDPAALQMAIELVQQLSWLHGTRPGRIETMLRRFVRCRQPWTAGHVITAIEEHNRRLRRTPLTLEDVRRPVALLAHYLRDFDPDADHPYFDHDPTAAARQAWSTHRQLENRLAIDAQRHGAGAGHTPEVRAAAITRIRDELAARRDSASS